MGYGSASVCLFTGKSSDVKKKPSGKRKLSRGRGAAGDAAVCKHNQVYSSILLEECKEHRRGREKTSVKMYKVRDIVKILLECQAIGMDGYCGFEFSESGNLVIVLKDHAPDWTGKDGFGEAATAVELLEDEGEY